MCLLKFLFGDIKVAKTKSNFFKLFVFILCVMIIPVFAGCSLITTNVDKQLNEVALDFDNGRITITREELIDTYRNYNSSSTSAPTEESVKNALDLALNREILVELLTSDADDMKSVREQYNITKVELTTYSSNEVWQNVYDVINDSVKNYEDDLRAEAKATISTGTSSTEDEEDEYNAYKYARYDVTYEYIGDGKLQKVIKEKEVSNQSIALLTEAQKKLAFSEQAKIAYDNFRKLYWNYTDSIVLNKDAVNKKSYSDEAWSKWINQLLRNENERKLSKVEQEAFLRYVEKVYKVYYINAIVTTFQSNFEDGLAVSSNMVVDKFAELYNAQVEVYDTDVSKFNDTIATSAEKIYYMKNPQDFFKVNHILVKFTDEQTKAIEALGKQLENLEISKADYDVELEIIKADTKAYNRETGEYETLTELKTNLNKALANASTSYEKFAIFGDFMHKYSEDTATINAESCYYIPVNNKKIKDAMQEAFANASRELYKTGIVGNVSDWTETSYGFHIIMYTGNAQGVSPTNNVDSTLANLNKCKLNPLYNKSLLDQVIEQVTLQKFSDFQEEVLDEIKANKKMNYNVSVYQDLYK